MEVWKNECFEKMNFHWSTEKKSLLILNSFLRLEQCSTKFILLSIVTSKSLKLSTTLTLKSSLLSLTNLEPTIISFGNLTLLYWLYSGLPQIESLTTYDHK